MRGPNHCYHFAKELAKTNDVSLFSLTEIPVTADARREMAGCMSEIVVFETGRQRGAIDSLLAWVPLVGRRLGRSVRHYNTVSQMKHELSRMLKENRFDVVLFHGKTIVRVLSGVRGIPIAIYFCDATSMRVRARMAYANFGKRLLLLARYFQVRRLENVVIRKSRHVAYISHRDKEAVVDATGDGAIVSIGVDHMYWKRKEPHASGSRIVFTGVMDYAPNVDAAVYLIEKVLPNLRKAIPDIEVFIVGRDPTERIMAYGRDIAEVTVTGYVDDVRPYLEASTVAAVPMRFGSGVQNKVLEMMAMEVPVVTMPIVAKGIDVDGRKVPPVIVVETVDAFSDEIVRLFKTPDLRSSLAVQGRAYVKQYFDWSENAHHLENLCSAAVLEWHGVARPSVSARK